MRKIEYDINLLSPSLYLKTTVLGKILRITNSFYRGS